MRRYLDTIAFYFSNSSQFYFSLLCCYSVNYKLSIILNYPPPTQLVGIEKQSPTGTPYFSLLRMTPMETARWLPWNQSRRWSVIALVAEIYAFPLVFYWMNPPLSYIFFYRLKMSICFIFSLTSSLGMPSTSIWEASHTSLREWFPQTIIFLICPGLHPKNLAVWVIAGVLGLRIDCSRGVWAQWSFI